MVDNTIPPTFRLSGTGSRPYFAVYGPYNKDDKNDGDSQNPIWAITTEGTPSEPKLVSKLPQITYGTIPSGFKQIIPKDGNPPNLQEGKYYGIYVFVLGSEGGGTCFGINQGKAIACQ